MNIIWSDFASKSLQDIYTFYYKKTNKTLARRIKDNIFTSTNQLINYPESGQLEESLIQLKEGHKYLPKNKYKMVY